MANEDVLRQRWGDIYHDTDEYQNAAKQAAVSRARQRASVNDVALSGAPAQTRLAAMESLQRPTAAETTLRGLDDYQKNRSNDFIHQTRARDALLAQTAPVSVGNGTQWRANLQDPDFSNDYPWMKQAFRGGLSNEEKSKETINAAPTSYGPMGSDGVTPLVRDVLSGDANQREMGQAAETQRLQTRRAAYDDYEAPYVAAEAAQKVAAKAAFDRGERQEQARIRAEQSLRQRLPHELAGMPDPTNPRDQHFVSVYDRMTPTEKADLLRQPPEVQQARLAGHPLRSVRGRPNQGGSATSGAQGGIQDFLDRTERVDFPGFGPMSIPIGGKRPTAELVR